MIFLILPDNRSGPANKRILEDFAKIAETRYAVGEGIQQDVMKAHVEVSKMWMS